MGIFPQRCLSSFLKGFDAPPVVIGDLDLSYREPLHELDRGDDLSDELITTVVVSIDTIQLSSTDIDSSRA